MSGGSHELLITHTHTCSPFPMSGGSHEWYTHIQPNPCVQRILCSKSEQTSYNMYISYLYTIWKHSDNDRLLCKSQRYKRKRENAPASFVLSSWRNEIAAHIICILEAVCGCRCVPFASTRPNNVCKFLVCNFNTCLHASM